jgi:GAF domain-containing protein
MEELKISKVDKEEKYIEIIPQIESIISGESYLIAKMANISSILKEAFDFWWIGFYLVDNFVGAKSNNNSSQLVLGPFQGPIACQRIDYGKGVCGTAWKKQETIIVPDVDKFPGHIACSSLSKSEIVVPIFGDAITSQTYVDKVIGVLDIDSKEIDTFDDIDKLYLEKIVSLL